MRIPAPVLVALSMALLVPQGGGAQQCPAPGPGAPIRFTHAREVAWTDTEGNAIRRDAQETRYMDASLVAVDGDTLRARVPAGELAIPLSEVESFRVRCPVSPGRSALRGFRTGFFVGAGAGVVLGLIVASGEDSFFGDAQTEVALLGAGAVGLGGGLLGALIGAAAGPGMAWTAVPLVAPPIPGTSGDWTVGLRIPLGR